MRRVLSLALLLAALPSLAQWQIVTPAPTTADLRGIHNVGNGVAWASGSNGTVLRTLDAGKSWTRCATPPDADRLDFRAVQAFDADTAIVMSIGKGPLSRLYKTTDSCHTWKLVFTNPDADGFWDAFVAKAGQGFLVGDPVDDRFEIYASTDGNLEKWARFGEQSSLHEFRFDLSPYKGEGVFAASNSALDGSPSTGITFVSGGSEGSFCFKAIWRQRGYGGFPTYASFKLRVPLAKGSSSTGAFSFATKGEQTFSLSKPYLVVVGGDYQQPASGSGTAAWSKDGGQHWRASATPPHGFRSAVAYDAASKTWITVGPNGTDISTDDGRNWRPLLPDPSAGDGPDADQHWNALSLPYVVGPHGRIGILRPSAISSPHHP